MLSLNRFLHMGFTIALCLTGFNTHTQAGLAEASHRPQAVEQALGAIDRIDDLFNNAG